MSQISWSKLLANPPTCIPTHFLPTYKDAIRDTETALAAHANDYIIGLDLETTGLYHWLDEIRVVQLYGYPSNKLSILHYPTGNLPENLIQFLSNKQDTIWVGQNIITFDARFLHMAGVDVFNMAIWDTLLVEGIINATYRRQSEELKNDLQSLIARHLEIHIPKQVDHNTWQDGLFQELNEEQMKYAADDVRFLTNLLHKQITALRDNQAKNATVFELNVAKPILKMSLRGLPIDRERFNNFLYENLSLLTAARRKVQQTFTGNPESPAQLTQFLTQYGIPNTNAQTLREHLKENPDAPINEFVQDLLVFREYSKLNKMYNTKWLSRYLTKAGTVASNYTQTSTGTYRTSSRNPNAQNYPRSIRQIFGHPTEWMVVADYSTVEMRIAAQLTAEDSMIRTFDNNEDIHGGTATKIFMKERLDEVTKDQRQAAKAGNFAMIFGGSANAIIRQAENMSLPSIPPEDAERMRQEFFDSYIMMADFHSMLHYKFIRNFNTIKLHQPEKYDEIYQRVATIYDNSQDSKLKINIGPFGHTRVLYDDDIKITTALNTPIQGTAAIGLKTALLYIYHEAPELLPHLAGTVHDEIILTGYNTEEEARIAGTKLSQMMIKGMERVCPGVKYEAEAGVGHYWNEAK